MILLVRRDFWELLSPRIKMRTCVLNASLDSLRYFSYALADLTNYVTLTKTDSSDLVLSQFTG